MAGRITKNELHQNLKNEIESKASQLDLEGLGTNLQEFANQTNTQLAQKANKQQENWIKPLLQNGWLFQGDVRDISYYKDEIGQVRLTGEVLSGIATNGTIILTMPVGYRPRSTIATLCVKANDSSHFVVSINALGEVSITGLNSTGTLRINVSFRVA